MGRKLRNTFKDVKAVFSPACIAHEVLTKSHWISVAVNQVTLPDAIDCWASSLPRREEEEEGFGAIGLEVRAQLAENFLEGEDEEIIVPVRIHR